MAGDEIVLMMRGAIQEGGAGESGHGSTPSPESTSLERGLVGEPEIELACLRVPGHENALRHIWLPGRCFSSMKIFQRDRGRRNERSSLDRFR